MIQLQGTLHNCADVEPHIPHSLGKEDHPLYGSLHRICLGAGRTVGAGWRAHPAGGMFALAPLVPSAPIALAYVHEDDEQELLAEIEEQAEALREATTRGAAQASDQAPAGSDATAAPDAI